jgi:LysM domain
MISLARFRLAVLFGAFAAPGLLAAQNSRPETHTVRTGDTLWDLSRTYLGDPFLWPEIYRLNTNVVEDPHWIYPGEVLRLGGGAEVSSVPQTDTPPPAMSDAPDNQDAAQPENGLAEPQVGDLAAENASDNRDDIDLTPLVGDHRRVAQTGPSLELALARAYRPVRRTEFFSSGFLSEDLTLPFGQVLGTVTPLQIEEVSSRSSALMYGRVAVKPPAGGRYQVGDTLVAVIISREIRGHGHVIVPMGLLRVLDVSRPENLAEVIAAYAPIRDQQSVLPVEKFNDPGNVHPVPISDGVQGTVLGHRDEQPLTGPQDVIFIDRGRKDGVALGDMFEFRQSPRSRPDAATVVNEVMGTAQVVHVGDHTATVRIVSVIQPDIQVGTEARQIAKLPS